MTGTPETITRDELAEALSRFLREHRAEVVVMESPEGAAAALVADIAAHREPEYEPGEIYQDAGGVQFYRLCEFEDGRPWLDIEADEAVRHATPVRPLRKLVPEGSPLTWERVKAVLDAAFTAEDWDRRLMPADLDPIMKLLAGEA